MTSRAAERKRTSVQTLNVLGFPCKLNPTVQCPTAHISKISKNKKRRLSLGKTLVETWFVVFGSAIDPPSENIGKPQLFAAFPSLHPSFGFAT